MLDVTVGLGLCRPTAKEMIRTIQTSTTRTWELSSVQVLLLCDTISQNVTLNDMPYLDQEPWTHSLHYAKFWVHVPC